VITKLELGGAQQNTLYTVSHLDRTRFEPLLAAGTGGLLDEEAARLEHVEVHFLPSLRRAVRPASDLAALLQLTALFRRRMPDIVHTHSSKAGILGRWAAHLAGVPVVIHSIHGFGFTPAQSPLVRGAFIAAERATARITTRFIAVSRANLEEGIRRGLFDEDRAVLIRSGVELGRFMNSSLPAGRLRSEIGASPETPIAGMVACFKPQKSPEDFVSIAGMVARRVPSARFVLVGDGELRGDVEGAIRREGLEGQFHLLGWRRDIPEILHDLDVLVLTSRWEGLPRVFPEAMAAGKPVVACRVDGAAEAVLEGETGFLCEPGERAVLAERLVSLLSDRDRAREMGQAGRLRAGEWDIDEMVRRQERLYQELLQSC
jgi:glycosyltransferase involved in cell wall biosynthesis